MILVADHVFALSDSCCKTNDRKFSLDIQTPLSFLKRLKNLEVNIFPQQSGSNVVNLSNGARWTKVQVAFCKVTKTFRILSHLF